jgi:hypothetical protein
VEDSCEHGVKTSDSIKYCEILKWLRNWWLLRRAQLHGVGYVTEEVDSNVNALSLNLGGTWFQSRSGHLLS